MLSEREMSARVDVQFSPGQIEKLKEVVGDKVKDGNGSISISRQDVITAYLVWVINKCVERPVTCVQNNFNASVSLSLSPSLFLSE